MQRLYIF